MAAETFTVVEHGLRLVVAERADGHSYVKFRALDPRRGRDLGVWIAFVNGHTHGLVEHKRDRGADAMHGAELADVAGAVVATHV
jgi:hypothetical protein